LFNAALSRPINDSDRDAIFLTSILLAAIALYSLESTSAETAWPLTPLPSCQQPELLDWLRMKMGVGAIFHATNPMRPGGLFNRHSIVSTSDTKSHTSPSSDSDSTSPDTPPGTLCIPTPFMTLYNIHPSSHAQNNPYHTAVHILSRLWTTECNDTNIMKFFAFTQNMTPEFKALLEARDAKALLLLAYWFAMVCKGPWWLSRRARLEGKAICLWIEVKIGEEGLEGVGSELWQELLGFPRRKLEVV